MLKHLGGSSSARSQAVSAYKSRRDGRIGILRPSVPEQGKSATYESGEIPTGTARVQFNIQYYMVALLFVVFDIETV